MTVKNERNLLVKELIKNEVFSENVKYAKMYSNIKKDGTLRVKLFYLYSEAFKLDYKKIEEIKAKLDKLKIGAVEIVLGYYGPSLTVYIDKEDII